MLVLIYKLIKLKDSVMEDKKTTFTATVKTVLGIIAAVLAIFHIDMGPGVTEAILSVATGGYLIASWIQGLFTKDK